MSLARLFTMVQSMEQHTHSQPPIQQELVPAYYASGDFLAIPVQEQEESRTREKATFWRDTKLSNLELLRATFVTHTFAPHIHEGYAIGMVEKGAERFKYRKNMYVASQGSVVVINPGEMHTGEAASAEGWSYRMLYPDISLLLRAAIDATGKTQGIPFFPAPVIADPDMAHLLLRLHAALATSPSELERESLFIWTLAHLIQRHARTTPGPLHSTTERVTMLKVRAYLEEHYTENVSLDELATLVNFSPFHLLRVFRETVGLPPHSYLTQTRVAHAKRLISASLPLAEVATAVGFTDQSHLNRHFKALVGVTPGQYARGSR